MNTPLSNRSSTSPPRAASASLSTIARVWNDRLRASSSAPRETPEMCDVIEVTPSPRREVRLRVGDSTGSTTSSRLGAANGSDEGLTDSPAATAVERASSSPTLRCSVTRVVGGAVSPRSRSHFSLDLRDADAEKGGAEMVQIAKPLFPSTLLTEVPDEGRLLTLVLDLDETLVSNRDSRQSEAVLRPYCLHVLNALRHMTELEIVLWTASTKETASPVVEQLHQTGLIFDDVIYRNNLWFTQPIHTKDLRLLGRDMDRVLIVDNSVGCCKMHRRNSLLVEDFHGVRRRTDAALVNVYYVVDALLRMLRERQMSVPEGLRCLMAEEQLCHTVSYDLPDFFKNIPLMEVAELKRPPVGRFVRANTSPPNTSIMQHWVY